RLGDVGLAQLVRRPGPQHLGQVPAEHGTGPAVDIGRVRPGQAHARSLAALPWKYEGNAHRLTATSSSSCAVRPATVSPDADVGVDSSGRLGERLWSRPFID